MKRLLLAIAFAAAALVGCTTAPKTPAQAVYATHGTYLAALSVAVKYRQLPDCGLEAAIKPFCSEKAVVAKVQAADDQAYAALTAAQTVVRVQTAGTPVERALQAATQAVGAFSKLVNDLGVK